MRYCLDFLLVINPDSRDEEEGFYIYIVARVLLCTRLLGLCFLVLEVLGVLFLFFTNDREMRTGCPYHRAQTLRSYISVSFSDIGLFRILSLVLLATVFFFSAEKS